MGSSTHAAVAALVGEDEQPAIERVLPQMPGGDRVDRGEENGGAENVEEDAALGAEVVGDAFQPAGQVMVVHRPVTLSTIEKVWRTKRGAKGSRTHGTALRERRDGVQAGHCAETRAGQ